MRFLSKTINGVIQLLESINQFTGIPDQIVSTNNAGKIDPSLVDIGTGIAASASTGSAGAILESVNLSVSRTVTGFYNYTFNTPLPNNTYTVVATPNDVANSTDVNMMVRLRTSTGFLVEIRTGDNGGTADTPRDSAHSIVVISSAFASPPPEIPDNASESVTLGASGSDLSINYNLAVAGGTTVTFSDILDPTINGATIFSTTNQTITTNYQGKVEITTMLPHFSNGSRASLSAWIERNGVQVSARDFGYIRAASGHNRDTLQTTVNISCNIGDVFRVQIERAGNTNTATFLSDIPTLLAKRTA